MERGIVIADGLRPGARRLGILGGGQLARMLAEAALRQGVEPTVLVGSASDPAVVDGAGVIIGALDEPDALSKLAARSDVLTLENEFVDLDELRRTLARYPQARLRPAADGIAVAQDKLAQRRLFERLGIPAADFDRVCSSSLSGDLERIERRFPEGFVLKWSRFGYDGRGNLAVRPAATVPFDEMAAFVRRGEARGAEVYAERMVDFECELAMVSTRAADGDQVYYPLVISRQERGVCREILGPATAAGCDEALEREARAILRAIAGDLDLTGTLAVEFFLDRNGRLLVNELAPRVHNSGHYTLLGEAPSQFDLHVQAVAGLPLSRPAVGGLVVMRNLLGPWTMTSKTTCPAPQEPPPEGTALTWYGKREVSPGRKMGHLTGRASSLPAATELLQAMAAYETRVWSAMQSALEGYGQ